MEVIMEKDIAEVLVDRETIRKKVKELGERISKDYEGKELILVGVLKGSVIFLADLMREITIPVEVDLMSVSSYGKGTKSSGVVKIVKDIDNSIEGKHVMNIEDIIDTGLTLRHLLELLSTRNPLSLEICTIFNKPSRRLVDIDIKYDGIHIPDKFVIGYGLDYAGKYRNLPDLCTLKEEVYKKMGAME